MDRAERLDRHLRQPPHPLRRPLRQAKAEVRVQAGLGRHIHRHNGRMMRENVTKDDFTKKIASEKLQKNHLHFYAYVSTLLDCKAWVVMPA